jgi:hypothetical protein
MAWSELETEVVGCGLVVIQAHLACGGDAATLRIEGLLDGDRWCALFLRAGDVSVGRSDGVDFTVDELLSIGTAYWDAFDRQS